MTKLRQGFLSDESMMKECMLHHPIPMNRLDLLPRPMENRSGLYYRPLKETKIIGRPATAKVMLDATEKLTGNDLREDYIAALKETPKIVKFPTYPNKLPDTQGIRVAPNVGNAYSIATIAYDTLASQVGIPVSLSSGMSATIPESTLSEGDSASIPSTSTSSSVRTPSEPDIAELIADMSEEEREGERRARYVEIQEEVESGGIVVQTPPVVSQTAPPARPRPRQPVQTLQTIMESEQQMEVQQRPRAPVIRQEVRPVLRPTSQDPRAPVRQDPRPAPRQFRQIL